ncbi:unconventional myosin-XIX-like [Portunus trituberculatus]|uniref:unconventional myosin-XIX-like n=1 Tax=Portunus trituberculatus TaxID=210409 RepID=UPI001E1CE40B|nr:unconventional myosin-XIX-like [Portunus trituberculatus]
MLQGRGKVPPPVPRKKPKLEGVDSKSKEHNDSASNSVYHVPEEQLLACEDLLRLPILYDDIVLQCVHTRFEKGLFYTWAGPTLVAVNPCHHVDLLYTPHQIKHHHQQVESGVEGRSPHVYSVAGVAHHRLQHDIGLLNQAILVSGESGSGKTESARYMLGYLIHVEKHFPQVKKVLSVSVMRDKQPEDIQKKILASNPILEAFGNAATLRNHNSSRFGKLICLQYGGGQMCGAKIDTYLLEKTRVTHQPHHERNFHIFYQIVSGLEAGVIKDLEVKKEQKFAILSEQATASDLSNLHNTLHAFKQLQFSTDHMKQIFQVILALLYLGNIKFQPKEGGNTSWMINKDDKDSAEGLTIACQLLGLDEDHVTGTLTVHTINVISGGKVNVFHKPLERESQCAERRDALMQLLYQTLFLHIVNFINSKISVHRSMWSHFMGILDIYGFESFENNSLEQLCINYANERLQQAFILRYLATEHEILKEEGFLEIDIPYTDNSNCVMVIDSHVSVFAILNEECQLKRDVKEEEACVRICNALEDTGVVSAPPYHKPNPGFVIKHYAGPVQYEAHGLLHKNKDDVPLEVLQLLTDSGSVFMKELTSFFDNKDPEFGRRTTRKITTLAKFKFSLDSLMKMLSACDLHYVRCIKPSLRCLPGQVDKEYMVQQLRACGIIETVCISQAGYPVRMSYNDFIKRYGNRQGVLEVVDASMELATSVLAAKEEENIDHLCRFGHTRVFLSESALHTLEIVRERKRAQAATSLQKYWKRHKCWKQFRKLKEASLVLQKYIRMWLAKDRYRKMKQSCVLIQKNIRRFIVHQKYQRLHKATVIIQKYFRGSTARRRFEMIRQQAVARPYSSQSYMSMNSLGYCSLSTSISSYGIHHSLVDMNCLEASFGTLGALSINGDLFNSYISPQHHQRLLETEESGIETDTESINGDGGVNKPRKLRRRAQLQKLLQNRSRVRHVGSEESLVDTPDVALPSVEAADNASCQNQADFKENIQGNSVNVCSISRTLGTRYSSDERTKKDRPVPCEDRQKMRVATLRSVHEVSDILKTTSPSEDLQLVLLKQSISVFFKSGVLSYRRMPLISIKFHTRPTCLPFSHHLPHQLQPRGLWEALP